ncbi:MAG: 50S ribosomal protein L29 [Nanoarchaeota archaeon]
MKGLTVQEISKMDKSQRTAKLNELRVELIRSRVAGKSSKVRTKEIKKAIARLLTVINESRKSPSVTAH